MCLRGVSTTWMLIRWTWGHPLHGVEWVYPTGHLQAHAGSLSGDLLAAFSLEFWSMTSPVSIIIGPTWQPRNQECHLRSLLARSATQMGRQSGGLMKAKGQKESHRHTVCYSVMEEQISRNWTQKSRFKAMLFPSALMVRSRVVLPGKRDDQAEGA